MIDYRTSSQDTITNVTDTLKKIFPIEGRQNALVLDEVEVKPYEYDIDEEYNAKYHGRTLSTPVMGKLKLVSKADGKVINEQKLQLMKLPVISRRGTFIVGGNEYNVDLQNRRLPGVYPVRRDTGEVEGEFNIGKGGGGRRLNMLVDSQTGQFHLAIKNPSGSDVRKPLYPLLAALGVDDATLEKTWGGEILAVNRTKPDRAAKEVLDAAFRVTGQQYDNPAEAAIALRDKLAVMEVDPTVNRRTVGVEASNVSPELLVRTSQKLLNINRGLEEPTDRNALHFKSVHGVEDFFSERIEQHARTIKRKLAAKVDRVPEVNKIIASNVFTAPVEQLFTKTSLAEIATQYNPVDMLVSGSKITSLGEGGITNIDSVRDEMRALHNSHAGFFDPIHTPESEKIGVTLHLTNGAIKRGKKLYTQMIDAKTGQLVEVDHQSVADKIVALPGRSWDPKTNTFNSPTVRALVGQKMQEVPVKDIDYVIRNPQYLFAPSTSLVPFLNSSSGARIFMASKQMGQALNLKDKETPLVQSGKGKMSFEHFFGGVATGAVSPLTGTVKSIDDKYITLQAEDGKTERVPIYKNFPLNHEHFITTDKIHVTPGQKVLAGQPLLDNNFTKDGALALGANMRVAYLSDGGYNFEDGITLSQSAAKRMTSRHLYPEDFKVDDKVEVNAKRFMMNFPNKVSGDILKKFDDIGVIKPGAVVNPGEPLVFAVRRADADLANKTLASIGKKLKQPYRDASLYWEGRVPGTVTDVIKTDKGYKVYVNTEEDMTIADKMTGRYGNKGVVTRILPDEEMPRDKSGKIVDVLLNPMGIPSRLNPSQLLETAISKVAHKQGKPIIIESFTGEDHQKKAQDLLRKHGFSPDGTEQLFDAEGKSLGNVMTGYQYMLKLSKQAKTGFSARSAGAGQAYDIHQAPSKGGDEGSKAMDLLSLYAMLAHGATANLREMATDKASNNPEFWRAVRNGLTLPAPKPTFAYDKFMAYLRGSGVNVERQGAELAMTPLTDEHVLKQSGGEVNVAKFIQAKDLKPIRKGLVDPAITGGLGGQKWSHISLAAPVINPLFKGGLRELMDMTEDEVMAEIEKGGTKALQDRVKALDLQGMEAAVNDELKLTKSPQRLNKLNRRLHYIRALKNFEEDPAKAYFLTKYPIVPPNMRPIAQQSDGNQTVAQINLLYRDMVLMNNSVKNLENIPYLPDSIRNKAQAALQTSVEAVSGLTDPMGRYPKERTPKGFVEQIKGDHAKEGFFQRNVLRRAQDITGRGVITPDPKLGPDQIGLPEEMAWKIYDPFVERKLRQQGFNYQQIMDMIDKRSPIALSVLKTEMENRPVMLNRPPSLHKFSFLAFKPTLSNGQTIKIPPLVVKGFNADFDGDALMVHVPVRDEAVAEVRNKLMSTQNLFNPRSDEPIMVPSKEAILGIWKASNTAEGTKKLQSLVPEAFHDSIKPGMVKKDIEALLTRIGIELPDQYARIAQNIKQYGDDVAYRTGSTFTLDDLDIKDPRLDKIKAEMYTHTKRFAGNTNQINKILAEYDAQVQAILKEHKENNFVQSTISGAGAGAGQAKQIIASPVQYTDETKAPIPVPVTTTFGKGMSINDYWTSLFAARRGMIDRKMETADPGWFAKELLINSTRTVANENAPLEDEGEEFDVTDKDILNRYLAAPVKDRAGNVVANAGDIVTPRLASRLQGSKVDKVKIHTVLSALTDNGINPKSFGLFIEGRAPRNGESLGALAGQAIAEPLQQGAMKTFHTGGAVGDGSQTAGDVKGYEVIKSLLELPETFKNSATLAKASGKVTEIAPNPAGGYHVMIEGVEHYVRPGLGLKVKKGDVLEPGMSISSGVVHPRELLEVTNDMEKTRRYMVDALRDNYKATGTNVNRRILEVVVKSITDTAQVTDPGNSDYVRGDVVSYDAIQRHNRMPPTVEVVSTDIIGKVLGEKVANYPAGTVVTEKVMDDLLEQNIADVKVREKPITAKPVLIGVKTLPQKTGDLFTHMGYGYIERGLTEKVPAGAKIPLHGTNPIPAYAYGAEFGRGSQPHTY